MTDSNIRADAILSARRPGVTASSLRAGTEQSLRSVYSLGHSAIASLPGSLHSITEEAVTPFTLACFLVIIVEFGERFNYYTTKILYGSYCTQMLNMTSSEYAIFLNFNDFFNYGTGIIGAYIADAFLGRFKTICASAPLYIAGHVSLLLSPPLSLYSDLALLRSLSPSQGSSDRVCKPAWIRRLALLPGQQRRLGLPGLLGLRHDHGHWVRIH